METIVQDGLELTLSPWFEPHEEPVHNGLYQRYFKKQNLVVYAYFFDGVWYLSSPNIEKAYRYAQNKITAFLQKNKASWRGVVSWQKL